MARVVATVPIEVTTHVFVKAAVGGRTISLLLDSASHTFLNRSSAQAIGTPPYEVAIGGAHLTTAALAEFAPLSRALGRPVDGILGRQLFRRYIVELDYANGVMRLHQPESFTYEGTGERVNLLLQGGFAMVRAAVMHAGRAANGVFILDTGANNAVTLFSPFARRHQLAPRSKPVRVGGVTMAGEGSAMLLRVDGLGLGRNTFTRPVCGMIDRGVIRKLPHPEFAGMIGNELLRRFRVIFDYRHKELILEPAADLTAEFPFDRSGLQLKAEAGSLKTVVVNAVVPRSPATGRIEPGDVLMEIDDVAVDDLYIARRQLGASGTRRIKVRRGDNIHQITLATRPLL